MWKYVLFLALSFVTFASASVKISAPANVGSPGTELEFAL